MGTPVTASKHAAGNGHDVAPLLQGASGRDERTTPLRSFDDDNGKTGEASINALALSAITGGCGPRRYCPTSPVTREQMAAFLYRAHLQGRID